MKRILYCSLFWMLLSQLICYRLMGRSLGPDKAFFAATYAFGALFPIAMLLSRGRASPLPLLLIFSGLLTFLCVAWVWFAAVYIFF